MANKAQSLKFGEFDYFDFTTSSPRKRKSPEESETACTSKHSKEELEKIESSSTDLSDLDTTVESDRDKGEDADVSDAGDGSSRDQIKAPGNLDQNLNTEVNNLTTNLATNNRDINVIPNSQVTDCILDSQDADSATPVVPNTPSKHSFRRRNVSKPPFEDYKWPLILEDLSKDSIEKVSDYEWDLNRLWAQTQLGRIESAKKNWSKQMDFRL